LVGRAILIESKMALFYECSLKCARKVLDTADIVRDAWLQKLCATAAGVIERKAALGKGGLVAS
jgi:uncharacterized metal-binding protein